MKNAKVRRQNNLILTFQTYHENQDSSTNSSASEDEIIK